MKTALFISVVLLLLVGGCILADAAEAACPATQPTAPVDIAAGGKVCVRVVAGAPVTSLAVKYTGAMGETETTSYLPQTPLTQFADSTVVNITATPVIRGAGNVVLTSVGPGGQGVSPVLATIFLPYLVPGVPILMP